MRWLPRIPDLLTTANLCCGTTSILLASQGELTVACWLVFAGAAFDVLDGLAARALGGASELGKQLDSLADMVTFGVAPGMLIFQLPMVLSDPHHQFFITLVLRSSTAVWVGIASAWRLARFNVETGTHSGFKGLPTPANALFWASVGLSSVADQAVSWAWEWALLFTGLVLGSLMLSSIPLPSLKFKHFAWRGNEVIYLLLAIGTMLVVFLGMLAVPMILFLYLISPIWGRLFPKTT